MIRDVLTVPDERLFERAAEIEPGEEAARILTDLCDTVLALNGAGLAAPQIGEPVRALVIRHPDSERVWGMINPRIVMRSGIKFNSREGCLSAPGVTVTRKRSYRIWVHGQRADGQEAKVELQGLAAAAFQHELDHLDGVVIAKERPALAKAG